MNLRGSADIGGDDHGSIPDRIEATTLLIAAAVTRGLIVVRGVRADHLLCPEILDAIGVPVRQEQASLHMQPGAGLVGTHLATSPYPGIPTDVQPLLTALLCYACGTSRVEENVFPNRFQPPARPAKAGCSSRKVWVGGLGPRPGPTPRDDPRRTRPADGAALVIAAPRGGGRNDTGWIPATPEDTRGLPENSEAWAPDIQAVETVVPFSLMRGKDLAVSHFGPVEIRPCNTVASRAAMASNSPLDMQRTTVPSVVSRLRASRMDPTES